MSIRFLFFLLLLSACSKPDAPPAPQPAPEGPFTLRSVHVTGQPAGTIQNIGRSAQLTVQLSAPVARSSATALLLNTAAGEAVPFTLSYGPGDSSLLVQPTAPLAHLTRHVLTVSSSLRSVGGKTLGQATTFTFTTAIDPADKFPRIPDEELLTLVQRQTFRYFWDFGHPVSGLARERNTSGDIVTSGGSGFGVMAIVTGIHRGFVSRAQGLERMQRIVGFLKNNAQDFHGAFPHWLNGATGAVVPFSQKDNGADLVETSYLMQGLLTARQYFSGADAAETALRADINFLWERVEWDWFRRGDQQVLYWHWSPDYQWDINLPIRGWNESLITYVLAAASPTHTIPKTVYDAGWAGNGTIRNGQSYYGIPLPLGPAYGGPLFFAHYSFLGIDPKGLSDAYANYETQNRNHALIHVEHGRRNPNNFPGYSDSNWGLTASDDYYEGYRVHDPVQDNGVVSPTAALASFPYTPEASTRALHYFYYTLGDKLWKEYGFVDAFSVKEAWFAPSFLAIDQGPIIGMIENHRSGLLWDLFMSAPEVKAGLRKLGFSSPRL